MFPGPGFGLVAIFRLAGLCCWRPIRSASRAVDRGGGGAAYGLADDGIHHGTLSHRGRAGIAALRQFRAGRTLAASSTTRQWVPVSDLRERCWRRRSWHRPSPGRSARAYIDDYNSSIADLEQNATPSRPRAGQAGTGSWPAIPSTRKRISPSATCGCKRGQESRAKWFYRRTLELDPHARPRAQQSGRAGDRGKTLAVGRGVFEWFAPDRPGRCEDELSAGPGALTNVQRLSTARRRLSDAMRLRPGDVAFQKLP